MRLGIFGLWGMNVPGVAFGGFETAYSEIGARLAARGHDVVVYCRRERYPPERRLPAHRGVRLKYMPSIDTKSLSAVTATWMALADSLREERFDVYLFANVGMGFHCLAARLLGKRVVLNVDGLDWQRGKWGRLARLYFRGAARAALWSCHRLIADSRAMQAYYRERFGREATFIPYGADPVAPREPDRLAGLGVQPRDYFLIVSRFVPENNLDLMIEAFERADTGKTLLVVGGANHPTPYEAHLRARAGPRVLFPGYVRDRALLDELLCNSFAYLHGHSVGGTNPVLLDALAAGCCVLALDTPFNAEVLDGHGLLFAPDRDDLARKLRALVDAPATAEAYRRRAPERIRSAYAWDAVVDAYERLLLEVAGRRTPPAAGVLR